jgi:hypothetical protein
MTKLKNRKKVATKPKTKELHKSDVSGNDSLKLEHIAIIGKFSDGKCRQLLIMPKTQDVVLSAILVYENEIKVLDKNIDFKMT